MTSQKEHFHLHFIISAFELEPINREHELHHGIGWMHALFIMIFFGIFIFRFQNRQKKPFHGLQE